MFARSPWQVLLLSGAAGTATTHPAPGRVAVVLSKNGKLKQQPVRSTGAFRGSSDGTQRPLDAPAKTAQRLISQQSDTAQDSGPAQTG